MLKEKILGNNLYNFLFYLSLILPLALIAGPLISEIVIFYLIILFSYRFIENKKLFFNPNVKILYFFILFYIYLLFNSILNSVSLDLSFKNSFFYFRFLFFSYIFFFIIYLDENKFFKCLFFILGSIFLFFFIDLLFLIIFDQSISGSKLVPGSERFTSLFRDEEVMGGYVMKLLPSLLISLIFLKNKKLLFFSLLISGILIISSGERTSFAHFIILCFFLSIHKNFFKTAIISTFIFLSISTLLYFINFTPIKRIIAATIHEIIIDGRNDIVVFSDVHENMLLTSYEIFKKNIYFGTGPKTYRKVCSEDKYAKIVKEKIVKENLLIAKNDGYLYLKKFDSINEITNDPILKYVAYIFYSSGEKREYNLKRYRLDEGAVSKSYILKDGKETYQKVNFKKNDLIAKMSYSRLDGCDTHPHNLIAQIMSELGVIGLIFFLTFYLYLLKELFYAHKTNNKPYSILYYLSIVSLLINFFPFIPSGNFFNNWYSTLLYFPLGFFIYFNYKLKRN
ncbi:MAG: O-antigen ligase family protein [Candidatus Pelagibacter sp.]